MGVHDGPNSLDLDVVGSTLAEIHADGYRKAHEFFGNGWRVSLVRCNARPLIRNQDGSVLRYEADMTFIGALSD